MKEVSLSQGKTAIVDDGDVDIVSAHAWHAVQIHKCWYAATMVSGRRLYMHRLLLGDVAGDVDHVNHDGLDNRRQNLRVASRRGLNIANARFEVGATGFRGVTLNRRSRRNPYIAQIRVQGRRFTVGRFDQPEDAARAYDAAARHHFGEFATLNFPIAESLEEAS